MVLSRPFSFDEYALIIEHIVEDRQFHPTLKSLCLTQRSLVHLCQKRIFSSITCSPEKLDTFPDIARTSPHLFDYIRDFSYELDDSKHRTVVRRNKTAIKLFERLHDLRSLSVSGLDFRVEVFWDLIDRRVSNALLRLILSPSLRSLVLSRIQKFPPHGLMGLRNSKHLNTLSLANIGLILDEEDTTESMKIVIGLDSDSPRPRPSTFHIHANSWKAVIALVGIPDAKDFSSLRPVFDFTSLRKLYAESDDDLDSIANHRLINSASQLDELTFMLVKESEASFRNLAEAILGGPFQTLRHLSLTADEPASGDDDNVFLGSVQELEQLAGGRMKRLEEIALCFYMFIRDAHNRPKVRRIVRDIETECKAVDSIFVDGDAFPALSSISIYFCLMVRTDEPGFRDIEQEFNGVSQRIAQKAFQNLNAIPSISNSFCLKILWED